MAGRWLLDVNVPAQLVSTLSGFGVEAEIAIGRGWKELTNGRLLEAASKAGFSAILTRDRLFGQSAAKSLKLFPTIALVVVTLPQARAPEFLRVRGGVVQSCGAACSRQKYLLAMKFDPNSGALPTAPSHILLIEWLNCE
jgi:predicted nuclease of predicted toxin-antitoxin system